MSVPDEVVGAARVSRAGEGELLHGVAGVTYVVRVAGEQTGGELAVVECVLAPGAVGAAPHTHHGHAEHFLVDSGEVTFVVGHDDVAVGADGWVSVPRGVRHGFRNVGDVPALLRTVVTPAGYEGYFREIDALVRAGHEPDGDELAAMRSAYRTDSG